MLYKVMLTQPRSRQWSDSGHADESNLSAAALDVQLTDGEIRSRLALITLGAVNPTGPAQLTTP